MSNKPSTPAARGRITKAFARTYATPSYEDPWKAVEDYYRVLEYSAAHPNEGSSAVSTAVELPRGRIRPWMDDGSRPDPVRGIETLEARGWLDLDWDEPPFTTLNALVAWIFSGGSIDAQSFVPTFAIESGPVDFVLEEAFTQLDVEFSVVRRNDEKRATEYRPSTDASVLGRLLYVLGAPLGEKTADSDLSLPSYLDGAPRSVRLDFARVYVRNRGVERPDRPNRPVTFREERSKEYLREFRDFLVDVVGTEAWIRGSADSQTTFLTPQAAELLFEEPTLGTQ